MKNNKFDQSKTFTNENPTGNKFDQSKYLKLIHTYLILRMPHLKYQISVTCTSQEFFFKFADVPLFSHYGALWWPRPLYEHVWTPFTQGCFALNLVRTDSISMSKIHLEPSVQMD